MLGVLALPLFISYLGPFSKPEFVVPDELLPGPHHPLPWLLFILLLGAILFSFSRLLPVRQNTNAHFLHGKQSDGITAVAVMERC